MAHSVQSKTILVTGSNRGIGLELSRQLKDGGAEVIAVCRSAGPELSKLGVDVHEGIDVSSPADVESLVARLRDRKIDWLINNAGILEPDSLETLDFDSIERQFRVNALGPLRVASALLENLRKGSKVFVITSNMGSIGDNTSGGYYGYRISKAAVNMAFKSLSVDLRDREFGVFMLHPGFVATDMTGHRGEVAARDAALGLIERMHELDFSSTGTFRHARGHDLTW